MTDASAATVAELIDVDDPRWPETLRQADHDVHHLPAWSRVCAPVDGGTPHAVLVVDGDRRLLAPVIRRELASGSWDAISPYGYGGPVTNVPGELAFRSTAFDAACAALAERGCISWFVRLHPILDAGWDASGRAVEHGATVSVDLTLDDEAAWKATRNNHRRNIRRARAAGVETAWDETEAAYREFVRIYRAAMEHLEAAPYYFFDDEYFAALREQLGPDLLLRVATLESTVIAGSLFTASPSSGLLGYHLSATNPGSHDLQPSKVIIHDVRTWAADTEYRALHLGGGLGGSQDDALFRFKQGFAGATHPFRTVRTVLRPAEYRSRCEAAGLGGDPETGFFPAYRDPGAPSPVR